jgi:hypothetical protein
MRDGREADARPDTVNHQKRSEHKTVSAGFADPRTESKQWLTNEIAQRCDRPEERGPSRLQGGFDLVEAEC